MKSTTPDGQTFYKFSRRPKETSEKGEKYLAFNKKLHLIMEKPKRCEGKRSGSNCIFTVGEAQGYDLQTTGTSEKVYQKCMLTFFLIRNGSIRDDSISHQVYFPAGCI